MITNKIDGYYGCSMEYNPISETTNRKTGTKVYNYLAQPTVGVDDIPHGKPFSHKKVVLGDNSPLKQLGIDSFEIFKKKGEEAIVRFSSPYAPPGYSGSSLGFFQKTDKAEMKKFLSLLKDMNANGLKVPINALGVMLKRMV